MAAPADPFDLERFVQAQDAVMPQVLAELRAGRKRTHWMWFVFPQHVALGASSMARRFGVTSLDEARAYWAHPVLRERLRACMEALLAVPGRSAHDILGSPDDLKLRSSMTLFALAEPDEPLFGQVLDRFYEGPDPRTRALV